ncbi:hypothetical protein LOY67_18170 [Pseudomonas sp. B21-056]|jgi:hypothetical protein|nr:hypothetical protein LOY67_18170 [Pseudomonas sp. B21-056]
MILEPTESTSLFFTGPQLWEVRVCMDKALTFTSCGSGVKTRCRAGQIRALPLCWLAIENFRIHLPTHRLRCTGKLPPHKR